MLVVSGPVAESIGDVIGLGGTAQTVWAIAKWPVLAVVVVMVVALLYYATPNIQQPKFRWISVGAGVAIVIWVLASVGFAFYVANFGSYDKTYGSLAGVIVTLLWLWITNLALMLGAEIDSELERGRELQAGMPAEKELQLPARDTRNIEKAQEKQQEDIEIGRRIREQAAEPTAAKRPSPTQRTTRPARPTARAAALSCSRSRVATGGSGRTTRSQARDRAPRCRRRPSGEDADDRRGSRGLRARHHLRPHDQEGNGMKKLIILVAGGIGYVLGARAGRERYEQIRSMAMKTKSNPTVQNAARQAGGAAASAAPVVKDKVVGTAGAAADKVKGGGDDVPPRGQRLPLDGDDAKDV